MWEAICQRLSETLDQPMAYLGHKAVSGGCIHQSYALETSAGTFFLKTNQSNRLPVFEAEAAGLTAIRTSRSIRCPEVYLVGEVNNRSVLILEYIPMRSGGNQGMKTLGRQLAAMHKTKNNCFGWPVDNHIGLTPQSNTETKDWIEFLRAQRLQYQVDLCQAKGLHLNGISRLLDNLEYFFANYAPEPSLLHGDLWGGNIGFDGNDNPVVFDPACYFGDHEVDLAFTEMFGGFSSAFYDSYRESYPVDSGYGLRKRLYNLYHELNHFYLFGGSYGSQAQETVKYLISGF